MVSDNNSTLSIIILIVFGTLFCLLFGIFFYGLNIFRVGLFRFHFIVSGLAGSIFYALLKYRALRTAIYSLLTLYVLSLLIFSIAAPRRFITQFLYFAVLGGVIYLYCTYITTRFNRLRIGKFVFIAVSLTLLNAIVVYIYGLIISYPDIVEELTTVARLQILVGVGLGLGLETAELLPMISVQQNKKES